MAFRRDDGNVVAALHGPARQDITLVLSAAGFTDGAHRHEYVLDPNLLPGDDLDRIAYATNRLTELGVDVRLGSGLETGPPLLPDPGRAIAEIRLLTASLDTAWNPHEVALYLHQVTALNDSVLAAVDEFIAETVTWMGRASPVADDVLRPYATATRTHLGRSRVTAERLAERLHSLAELLTRDGKHPVPPQSAAPPPSPAKYPAPPAGGQRKTP